MRVRSSMAAGVLVAAAAAGAAAEEVQAVVTLRAEAVRLHAELVLLRRIRAAQRELIEWVQVSEGTGIRGLPPGICEASPLEGLCPRLGATFSAREEAK